MKTKKKTPARTTALARRVEPRALVGAPHGDHGVITVISAPPPPTPSEPIALTSAPYIGYPWGKEPFTEKQHKALTAPVDPDLIDILPTGEIYFPQVEYRRRLTAVFGSGGWSLKNLNLPIMDDNGTTLMQQWALLVHDLVRAVAWGEAEYNPSNKRVSKATALEVIKSNALMRCCKDLGIASECWDRRFVDRFIKANCIRVIAVVKNEEQAVWRRVDVTPKWQEIRVAPHSPNADKWKSDKPVASAPHPISQKQRNFLWVKLQEAGRDPDDVKKHIKLKYNVDHSADLPSIYFEDVLGWLASKKRPGE
jgi:hypothetical protein